MRRTAAAKPLAKPVVKPKSMAQAQRDFTSEGSPPPGLVAGSTPPANMTVATVKPSGSKTDA